MHFFTDYTLLTAQQVTDGFGPDSQSPSTKYNLTSKFQVSVTVKAFACQSGMMVVQESDEDESLVNVIIKPTDTLFSSGLKIAYYVYRGISKASLITTGSDNKNIVIPLADSNNDLLTRIYSLGADKIYLSDILGYASDDSTAADTSQHIDTIFYSLGNTAPIKVQEGDWFSDFAAGEIGFEIITEADKLNIDIAFVRSQQTFVDISALTDDFQIRVTKENILSFLDPAALFGLHYSAGITISTYSGSVKSSSVITGDDLFNTIISLFITKNNVYVDVRSEHGFSYNFYNNYGDDDGNNIQIGPTTDSLVANQYLDNPDNGWPILVITNPQVIAVDNNKSSIWLTLRVDDNVNPLLYHCNIGNGNAEFDDIYDGYYNNDNDSGDEGNEDTDENVWTNAFNYEFPNVSSSSRQLNYIRKSNIESDVVNETVAFYFKSYYYRQQSSAPVPATVLTSEKYYHSAFCSIDLPNIGSQTISYKKVESHHPGLINEPLQVNTQTGGFTFAANRKVLWDNNNVLFYSNLITAHISSKKKFSPTNTQKLKVIQAKIDDVFGNIDIICQAYTRVFPDGSQKQINIIGLNNNTIAKDANLESSLFLGLTADEFAACLVTTTGLSLSAPRYIYLQRNTVNALTDQGLMFGNKFYEYKIQIQGINFLGNAAMETPTTIGSNPQPILVYSRDNLFFHTPGFSAEEKLSPSSPAKREEINFDPVKGKPVRNDNRDFALLTPAPIHFLYDNIEIAHFDFRNINKMKHGGILGSVYSNEHAYAKMEKLTENASDVPASPWKFHKNYILDFNNPKINAQYAYHNDSGDIVVFGLYKKKGYSKDYNYQLIYRREPNSVVTEVYVDNTVNGKSLRIPINYPDPDNAFHLYYEGSQRRYVNPFVLSVGLAVFLEVRKQIPTYTSQMLLGFSYLDGTCYPSLSHNNGEAMDIFYNGSTIDNQGSEIDKLIVTKLLKYGFTLILVNPEFHQLIALGDGQTVKGDGDHTTHLHAGVLKIK